MHRTCLRKHTLSTLGKQVEKVDKEAEELALKVPFQKWVQAEAELMQQRWDPPSTEELEDGAEAALAQIVLFEDYSEWLFSLEAPSLLQELASHFVEFLGQDVQPFWPLAPGQLTGGCSQLSQECQAQQAAAALEQQPSPQPSPQPALGMDTKIAFVQQVLDQMHQVFPDSLMLNAIRLEFVASNNMKQARKCAKSLLKTNRTHFGLWNEYAQLELRHGHVNEAQG